MSTSSSSASKTSGISRSKVNSYWPAVASISGGRSSTNMGGVFSWILSSGEIRTENLKLESVPD